MFLVTSTFGTLIDIPIKLCDLTLLYPEKMKGEWNRLVM